MTKADLVEKIAANTGMQKRDSFDIVEQVLDLLKCTLAQGGKIKIAGFGNFEVRTKQARRGRNPQTGEQLEITGRKVVLFRPSKVLKVSLNKN